MAEQLTLEQAQRLLEAEKIKEFIFAGHAKFTIRSVATGKRYTYRVIRGDKGGRKRNADIYFCQLMTGPDNSNDFKYFGQFFGAGPDTGVRYVHGKPGKACASRSSESVKAFCWFVGNLVDHGRLSDQVEFWHEGQCGRCGRSLTVPESIESGYGPECLGKVGL